ncbi:MAG TPA: C1 family peptidase, partial [candidate division Zixibacteria bacterium]|nr:C1 family peptidase [candidate division Zixibacteria bacterium]
DYPYTASDAPCACPDPHPYKIRDWAFIDSQSGVPSVGAMKLAIYEHGPISVALAVTSPFHAYSGGVFNACSEGTINHAVTLVGWDDTMGDYGVWILRNSWGPGWGDNGYMYIAYGCLQVGYGACYVEYYGGVSFSADVQSGWGPLTVNFSGRSGLNLTDWSWDFGDGHTGAGQYTAHTYTTPGSFTVTVSAYDSLGGLRQISKPGFIAALADTVRPAHLAGSVNSVIQVPVCIRNNAPVQSITLPLTYGGPVDLVLDSWSTEGCRTDYFASVAPTYSHPEAKQATLLLLSSTDGSQPFLPPGEGPILKLYFSIPPQGNYGQVTPLDVSGYLQFSPIFHSPTLDWNPVPLAGSVTLLAQPGDCDGRTGLTIGDVTFLVGFLFRGGPAPDPAEAGDVDCSGAVGIGDITKLVAYMFRDGPAPVMCE